MTISQPLMLIAKNFRDEFFSPNMTRLLLANGANIDAQDNQGRTALAYAAQTTHDRKSYDFLLSLGANPNIKDCTGKTPLELFQKDIDDKT